MISLILANSTLLTLPLLQNFGEFNMWLAAEHGMFLRFTQGEWMTTMPENLHMDWVESVKVQIIILEIHILLYIRSSSKYKAMIHVNHFSMFLSISPRGHPALIFSFVRLHLCGIISLQVSVLNLLLLLLFSYILNLNLV